MQIVGGESYMTENELERIFRDTRIDLIVEGANEVMQCYIFGYGGKQLAEQMLGIKTALLKEKDEGLMAFLAKAVRNSLRPAVMTKAVPLGLEVFFGIRRPMDRITKCAAELQPYADRLSHLARELTYQFKANSKRWDVAILDRQSIQARVANVAILLHAWGATLAKLDSDIAGHAGNGAGDTEFQRDKAAAIHFFDLAQREIETNFRALYVNADESMLLAASAAIKQSDAEPNSKFSIPEKSPIAKGTGRVLKQEGIKQFPGFAMVPHSEEARAHQTNLSNT
jgi:hypothetical protein